MGQWPVRLAHYSIERQEYKNSAGVASGKRSRGIEADRHIVWPHAPYTKPKIAITVRHILVDSWAESAQDSTRIFRRPYTINEHLQYRCIVWRCAIRIISHKRRFNIGTYLGAHANIDNHHEGKAHSKTSKTSNWRGIRVNVHASQQLDGGNISYTRADNDMTRFTPVVRSFQPRQHQAQAALEFFWPIYFQRKQYKHLQQFSTYTL